MPLGLSRSKCSDVPDIVKYDARAGRLFRVDFNIDTREKTQVDITTPPPRFAIDLRSLEVGYIYYTANGPDYRTVPVGSKIPEQPQDKDAQGQLLFRPGFRVKLYGKSLGGMREWSCCAKCVLESLEDLYNKFLAAPEAAKGQIPIVELSKTLPVTFGKGPKASTSYAPCFTIGGWTDRQAELGPPTVPAPAPAAPAVQARVSPQVDADLNDAIPF